MKLKERFRKALFHFFKEEILEFTAPHVPLKYEIHETQFKVVRLQAEIDLQAIINNGGQSNIARYEYELDHMKNQWWEQLSNFITIEEHPLIDPRYSHRRKVYFSLLVAHKKK